MTHYVQGVQFMVDTLSFHKAYDALAERIEKWILRPKKTFSKI
jgi:hypothetical protein